MSFMGVIRVRLDDEDEAWLRKRGIEPGQFVQHAVHEAVRRLQIREASEFLAKNRIKFEKSVEEMIREDRDSR